MFAPLAQLCYGDVISMSAKVTLKAAAGILGKSTRQVMRDVAAGKLRARGGGRGTPFSFERAAVVAYAARPDRLVDAPLLARIAYAAELRRRGPCRWLPAHESTMLWTWHKAGKRTNVDAVLRCFPPLDSVPVQLRSWGDAMARKLSAREMDYLAAMFVCVAHPWRKYDMGARFALKGVPYDSANLDTRAAADRIIGAYEAGDGDAILEMAETQFPEYAAIARPLARAAWKQKRDRRDAGRGKPSSAKVGTLLGVSRVQAGRILEGIFAKLSRREVLRLAELLHLAPGQVPRAWSPLRERPKSYRAIEPREDDYFEQTEARTARRGKARCTQHHADLEG